MRNRIWCIALVFTAGCDSHGLAPVSGRVTMDGKPLADVYVVFEPADGRPNPGMGSIGKTDADGHYSLHQIQPDRAGAVVGRHRVTIRRMSENPTPAGADRTLTRQELLWTAPDLFLVSPEGDRSADFSFPLKSTKPR